jgi:MMPL family
VHEAWVATRDAHRSVAIGIGSTARVITTAAAIMVVVFASFVLNTDPTVKMLSIGMAFAVLIDASLVRMMLVPSVMALLGEHAWWMPRWLEPIVPHLQLEGSTEPLPAAGAEPEPVAVEEVAVEEAAVEGVAVERVAPEAGVPEAGVPEAGVPEAGVAPEAGATSPAEVTPSAEVTPAANGVSEATKASEAAEASKAADANGVAEAEAAPTPGAAGPTMETVPETAPEPEADPGVSSPPASPGR